MFNWFKIFNRTEFDALGLVSKTYTLELEDIGIKNILVTKGITHGLTYEGVFLSLLLNDLNPFEFEGYAIYLNTETNDVYLGIAIPEDDDE